MLIFNKLLDQILKLVSMAMVGLLDMVMQNKYIIMTLNKDKLQFFLTCVIVLILAPADIRHSVNVCSGPDVPRR